LSALAGAWSFGDEARAAALTGHLLDAQSVYGPHSRDCLSQSDYSAGRCLYRLLPEDDLDRQPLTGEDKRFILVADLRIDNRDELVADLAIGAAAGCGLADSELLLRGWLAWGRGLLTRMIGDFAFALWDGRERTLLLARDTAGERPLHYRAGAGFLAFASLPAPLASLPGERLDIDEEKLAGFVADLPPGGRRSFFAGVSTLEPGCFAIATSRGLAVERYWEPGGRTLRFACSEDYGAALRDQLDSAVARRLRARGPVGSQLSSGFDSSAVTTSAALALAARGERLLAFTSAPREGFDAPVVAGRIADESGIAAATAALHPNVHHRIVRPSGMSALDLLERSHRLAGQPVGHVCNNVWWQSINRAAGEAGVRVMLTGEAGNFTISAGLGVDTLADLVRTSAWKRWWREAQALERRGEFGWLQLLNASFAPWLPEGLYARIRGRRPEPAPFVAAAWREKAQRELDTAGGWGIAPPRNSAERRRKMLRLADPGNYRKRSLAEWGVEERDPTNDRRLVDFCFSLPPEALLEGGERRPALRRALSGRVPQAVLDQRLRGYQMPDWYEQIRGEEVQAFARAAAESGLAGSVVDLAAMDKAARNWPRAGWEERPIIYLYRMQLLRTLAAASFAGSVRSGKLG
jgi:asparagine synthase (glutamine-hydrolysing)